MFSKDSSVFLDDFLGQLDKPFTGEKLFDQMHDIVFFIKDNRGAYLVVNRTLVERAGARLKADLIGRTAEEVLGRLGAAFAEQDRQLLSTGKPLLAQLELHVHPSGTVGWCKTTKIPLKNKSKRVIGLVGVSRDLQTPDLESSVYDHVAQAVQFAMQNLSSGVTVRSLAEVAELSRFQLDRRMLQVFGLKTGQWLRKLRIDAARDLLVESDQSICSIATEVGYFDQSAFSRQFRKATGLTPREFRNAQAARRRV